MLDTANLLLGVKTGPGKDIPKHLRVTIPAYDHP
jgi:hypothetical protein